MKQLLLVLVVGLLACEISSYPTGTSSSTSTELDSVVVEPDSLVASYEVLSSTDTTWTYKAFEEGVMIDSVSQRTYQLTAYGWLDLKLVACSGANCPAGYNTYGWMEMMALKEQADRKQQMDRAFERFFN